MPSIQIYLEKEEDEKVWKLSTFWKLSKHDTIKKMIREFILRKERKDNERGED